PNEPFVRLSRHDLAPLHGTPRPARPATPAPTGILSAWWRRARGPHPTVRTSAGTAAGRTRNGDGGDRSERGGRIARDHRPAPGPAGGVATGAARPRRGPPGGDLAGGARHGTECRAEHRADTDAVLRPRCPR